MDVIETLSHLVRINSVNAFYPDGPGEGKCAHAIGTFWRDLGIEAWIDEVLPGRPNVVARIPGRHSDRKLILEAHMDTVSIEGMSIDPFDPRIVDGKLFGRGACDTKAGLAGMMVAMQRAHREQMLPPCEVWMAAVIDEEHSCRGVKRLCEGLVAHGAVVAEPTELKIVVASKGVLRWRIVAHGLAAHSSKTELGVNAIHHMARLVMELEDHHNKIRANTHPLLGNASANVGLISGGVQVNFVPDRCAIEIDRRMLPDEDPGQILAEYQTILNRLHAQIPKARFELQPPHLLAWGLSTETDSEIVQTALHVMGRMGLDVTDRMGLDVIDRMGLDTGLHGVAFGSDASWLQQAGVPSILFGPGSIDQAHTVNEHVDIEQVQVAHEFYYSIMKEFGR